MFNNQKVLVTGGSGMIGRQLVKKLVMRGAKVTIADLTEPEDLPENVEFVKNSVKLTLYSLSSFESVRFG